MARTTKPKRQRSDSKTAAAKTMASAGAEVIDPPSHINLRPGDRPFWDSIVRARARDLWTHVDLENAANLARCKADIERIQKLVDIEGDIVVNAKGTPIPNPRHSLIETLSRRVLALSRMLHVHAEATVGNSRDSAKAADASRRAAKTVKKVKGQQQEEESLIPFGMTH